MNLAKRKNEVKNGWTNMSQWVTKDLGTWDILEMTNLGMLPHLKNDQIADNEDGGPCPKARCLPPSGGAMTPGPSLGVS